MPEPLFNKDLGPGSNTGVFLSQVFLMIQVFLDPDFAKFRTRVCMYKQIDIKCVKIQ